MGRKLSRWLSVRRCRRERPAKWTISGNGGLTVTGGGNLELTASNTYTGATTVSGGILRLSNSGALPTGSNLTLDGGVVELNAGDFTAAWAVVPAKCSSRPTAAASRPWGEPRRKPQ